MKGGKFGSELTITQDLSIFSSATGYNNNEDLSLNLTKILKAIIVLKKPYRHPLQDLFFGGLLFLLIKIALSYS